MSGRQRIVVSLVGVAVAVFWGARFLRPSAPAEAEAPVSEEAPAAGALLERAADWRVAAPAGSDADRERPADADGEPAVVEEEEPEQTEEERREAEDERLVEAFDNLTDAWMDGGDEVQAEGGVPRQVDLEAIQQFARTFLAVPDARKEECLHRALNLIPDRNVMLLVGILLDKTIDPELVSLVYNDVLNRNEEVKKPILLEIFKDKTHPCWADTAWILDVTGEVPVPNK